MILITYGAEFTGSAVVRYIINGTSSCVINFDKLTYTGDFESLKGVKNCGRYFFEQVDICDRAELDRVFKQYQPYAAMHLAAKAHDDCSITGPSDFIQTNIVGTYTLPLVTREYWNTLSVDNKRQLWVAKGFAHGFYVKSYEADFLCKCTNYYHPSAEHSFCWGDETLGIKWPISVLPKLSAKDKSAVLFSLETSL